MINSLTGEITHRDNSHIYIDVNGVEYCLIASKQTLKDTFTRILTYLIHKEDKMALYGFSKESERHFFLSLLKIGGIGPTSAINICSHIDKVTDVQSLRNIPGIGKKTAEKIYEYFKGSNI